MSDPNDSSLASDDPSTMNTGSPANPPSTNEISVSQLLEERLRDWSELAPRNGASNLSVVSLNQLARRRRKLKLRSGGVVAGFALLMAVWFTWPALFIRDKATSQLHEALVRQETATDNSQQTIKSLGADIDRTLAEIEKLRWQCSVSASSLTTPWIQSADKPGLDAEVALAPSTAMDSTLESTWQQQQAARRQAALSRALDDWLAVNP